MEWLIIGGIAALVLMSQQGGTPSGPSPTSSGGFMFPGMSMFSGAPTPANYGNDYISAGGQTPQPGGGGGLPFFGGVSSAVPARRVYVKTPTAAIAAANKKAQASGKLQGYGTTTIALASIFQRLEQKANLPVHSLPAMKQPLTTQVKAANKRYSFGSFFARSAGSLAKSFSPVPTPSHL